MCVACLVCMREEWAVDVARLMSEVGVDIWVMTGVVAAGPTIWRQMVSVTMEGGSSVRGKMRDAAHSKVADCRYAPWLKGGQGNSSVNCSVTCFSKTCHFSTLARMHSAGMNTAQCLEWFQFKHFHKWVLTNPCFTFALAPAASCTAKAAYLYLCSHCTLVLAFFVTQYNQFIDLWYAEYIIEFALLKRA